MGKYTIRVGTGDSLLAFSCNQVQLWLVGEHGEADLGKRLRPLRREVGAKPTGRGGRRGVWGGDQAGHLQPDSGLSGEVRARSCAHPPVGGAASRRLSSPGSRDRRSSKSASGSTWGACCW